jgi:hypothetical protein
METPRDKSAFVVTLYLVIQILRLQQTAVLRELGVIADIHYQCLKLTT